MTILFGWSQLQDTAIKYHFIVTTVARIIVTTVARINRLTCINYISVHAREYTNIYDQFTMHTI
jgi:hypothetical protein